MRHALCSFMLVVLWAPELVESQQASTVFKGRPAIKISEGGTERLPEVLPVDQRANLECVISRISDSYYWASRENVQMARVESGAFITFVSLTGNGYVRVVKPEFKTVASTMSSTEQAFDYVEHAVIGLRSVTYYGTRQ